MALAALLAYGGLWISTRALWARRPGSPDRFSEFARRLDPADPRVLLVEAIVFGLLTCMLFVWLVLRADSLARRGRAWVAVAIPVVVAVALSLLPPTLSDDVYAYLSHGYLSASGRNPYTTGSQASDEGSFGRLLEAYGYRDGHPPTPYGPLWTLIERGTYGLTGTNLDAGAVLVKLIGLASLLLTTLVIHRTLRQRGAASPLRGSLLFLANPLVLVEVAGDGHNDGLMALLAVAAVAAARHRRTFLAVLAIGGAALVKSSVLPLLVPILVFLFVHRTSVRSFVVRVAAAGVVVLVAAAALIAPYWAGVRTFAGLASSSDPEGQSVAGLLRHITVFIATRSGAGAPVGVSADKIVLLVLLAAGTVVCSAYARTERGLLRGVGSISLVILLLLPSDLPWYGLMSCALLPLVPDLLSFVAVLLLAVTSRIAAPLYDAHVAGAISSGLSVTQTFGAQLLPTSVALMLTGLTAVSPRRLSVRLRRLRARLGEEPGSAGAPARVHVA